MIAKSPLWRIRRRREGAVHSITIGAEPGKFLSICTALHELTNPDGGLPFSHPTVEAAPRAFWWACEKPQSSSVNPTGMILSYLWKNGITHPWMKSAEAFCWNALTKLDATCSHSIQNGLAFLAGHPDTERAEQAMQKLGELLRQATAFHLNADGYVFSPLHFAPNPTSPAAHFYTDDEIRPHLQALINQQQDDGGWPINWPAISPGVLSECRGIITLRNLRILRDYGWLEVPAENARAQQFEH